MELFSKIRLDLTLAGGLAVRSSFLLEMQRGAHYLEHNFSKSHLEGGRVSKNTQPSHPWELGLKYLLKATASLASFYLC